MRIKNYEHCEGEEKYENISVFLVFFFFAHLQIFRLYSTLKAPKERKVQYMEKYIKQNGITYELRGEQYYPLLELPEQKKVGKYGRLHLEYLKEHRKGRYTNLLSEGTLNQRLYEIDLEAKQMLESIITRLATERGIDENMKARDMLRWAAEMNNIKASVEEIVLREVVYV
ncbi:MAG: TnpV protein [Clostridia bacterium]|nr:TnpV protein [Clostridia bacterium]